MSKNLAKLLAKPEEEVAKTLRKLEEICGYPSEDVRILAETKQKIRTKITQLGLDPDDTTDDELYHALRTRFINDSHIIDKAVGVTQYTGFDERLNKAIQLVNHCSLVSEMWSIKNSVIKSVLLKNPPRQLARKLNYRSTSSLIKREDIYAVYLAANVLESATWRHNMVKQLAKLNSTDYELRTAKIVKLPENLTNTQGPDSYLASDERLGAMAIWPTSDLKNASVLSLALLLLDSLHELNPGGYSESLHDLSPALRWWIDGGYLISDSKQTVSFNIKDVALNYLKGLEPATAASHHAAESLWTELTNRYQQLSDRLTEIIPDITYNFSQVKPSPALPTEHELAEEFITVE